MTTSEQVNSPPHYNQHAMECIDALRVLLTPDEFRGFCLGNMLKYRWRAHDKHASPEQDLAKADWYERCLADAERPAHDHEANANTGPVPPLAPRCTLSGSRCSAAPMHAGLCRTAYGSNLCEYKECRLVQHHGGEHVGEDGRDCS
ncbi:MAG: DUF3310 domain-containing protein [Acidimicrobiales bacterium]